MSPSPPIPHSTGLLLVLTRVRRGAITVRGSDAFDLDQPFPYGLVSFLQELFDHGQVCLDGSEPQRVLITDAGEALLAELKSTDEGPSC